MAAELFDFWVIIFFSLIGVMIATRLKLPSVIGVLLFGALIGPNGFALVKGTDTIAIFSELGAILLLFFIGIEFSLEKILKYGLRASILFVLKFGFIFFLTYLVALFLDISVFDALLIGIILSLSSTAIFARLVSEIYVKEREEAKLMSAVLVIEDIFAIFIITILSQLGTAQHISIEAAIFPIIISLLILSFSYVILRWLINAMTFLIGEKNTETQIFSALALCALFASLATFFGVSSSIGAFLAGSVFSSIKPFRQVENTLHQFIFVFAAFFFFSIGMLVNPVFIFGSLALIVIFCIVNLVSKFLSVSISAYLLGFDSRSSVFSALLMLTVSEFALLISLEANSLTSFDLVSFSATLMFLSSLISGLLYRWDAPLNAAITTASPDLVKTRLKHLSVYMNHVIRNFEPGGTFFKVFNVHAEKLMFYLAILILINTSSVVLHGYFIENLGFFYFKIGPFDSFILLSAFLSLSPFIKILKILKILLDEFPVAFHLQAKYNKFDHTSRVIMDCVLFFFFFGLSVIIPLILSALSLPRFLQPLSILPLLISFAFIWDLTRIIGSVVKPKKYKYNRY